MPFFFIFPLWLLLVLLAVPLFFSRSVRFLGAYVVIASTLAVLISFALSTLVLAGVPRFLPPSRFSGVILVGLYVFSILGGGGAGLLLGIVLAHRLNKSLGW
jgi:hypothetical protein